MPGFLERYMPYKKYKKKTNCWAWIFAAVVVVSVTKCTMHSLDLEHQRLNAEAAEQAKWLESPEYRFRFCLTTAAGPNGTASLEQIIACRNTTPK